MWGLSSDVQGSEGERSREGDSEYKTQLAPQIQDRLSFVRKRKEWDLLASVVCWLIYSIRTADWIGFILLWLNVHMFVWFHLTEKGDKHKSSSREGAGKATLESIVTALAGVAQ